MVDYQKMYTILFNAITDAIENIQQRNYGNAEELLVRTQQETEELYIDAED